VAEGIVKSVVPSINSTMREAEDGEILPELVADQDAVFEKCEEVCL
jgi:hypothetical protein